MLLGRQGREPKPGDWVRILAGPYRAARAVIREAKGERLLVQVIPYDAKSADGSHLIELKLDEAAPLS
jgi:hypothetical protein